ncbi:MAG: hypothetical protein SGILL_002499 [Bacillariaceae sp.]
MADQGAINGTLAPSSPSSSSCGLEECTVVCPANVTALQDTLQACKENEQGNNSNNGVVDDTVTLKFLTASFGDWIEPVTKQFSQERSDVNVELVFVSLDELSREIINEARSRTGLFDGFITPPGVMGSIVEENGWADLRSYIESNSNSRRDWVDIFLSYRKWISQYQDQILMYPLDGDVLSLFYRQDVLDHFGLEIPRTWEQYNDVAAATHGKVFKNQTLIGSCIGRVKGCAGAYWANLVLSSMTQFRGTWEGHLFDSKDMTPLLGEAFEKMLEFMEIQTRYGPEDEFSDCVDLNSAYLNDGSCVMSYNWGNTFKTMLHNGTVFQQGNATLSVYRTPGSTHVLDRNTMKLVPCNEELCPFASYYDDAGWVNRAPYLAFGGWYENIGVLHECARRFFLLRCSHLSSCPMCRSCAVNNYTTPGKKDLATEFCAYASKKETSNKLIAQKASEAVAGPDPFRHTQLDVDLYGENGYPRESVEAYFDVLNTALDSDNAVVDIRFPTSSELYALLDEEVHDYLNGTIHGDFSQEVLLRTRKDLTRRVGRQFEEIITEYDSQASTRVPALEQYQKLRNVYKSNNTNRNQLGSGIRAYGFAIASVTMLLAGVFAFWSYQKRATPVVKASQPFFLILICLGVFVMASSIFPMAIDDGYAPVEACDRACMAIPWLITMGWSILFAALYAKLRRVNIVIRNAMAFRSIKVSERDVMLPFAVLFTSNLILMTIWTILDPLVWIRSNTSPTESYGACKIQEKDSASWKAIISLIAVLNGAALIGANLEAYRARNVDTEFGESSYIGLTMGSFLQVIAVGLPLFFLVNDNPTATFFLTSSMVFLMCISVLLLLFIPKWRTHRIRQSQNAGRPERTGPETRITRLTTASTSNGGRNPVSDQIRYNEAAWIEKVRNLESALEEAGIDPKPYMREADILDGRDEIMTVSGNTSVRGIFIPSASHYKGKSSMISSLVPMSEAAELNEIPEGRVEERKEIDSDAETSNA